MLARAAVRRLAACVGAVLLFAAVSSRAADKPKAFIDLRVGAVVPASISFFRWRGRPFVIVRTADDMLDDLRAQTSHTWSGRPIADRRPAFFLFCATSLPRRCTVVHAPSGAPRYAPERRWRGGFYDPCRFGEWDYAGRTIRQYADQDEAMRRPDLDALAFELKDRSTVRVAR